MFILLLKQFCDKKLVKHYHKSQKNLIDIMFIVLNRIKQRMFFLDLI